MNARSLFFRGFVPCAVLVAAVSTPRSVEAQTESPVSQNIELLLQFQVGNPPVTTQGVLPPNSQGSGFVVNAANGGTVNVNSMQNNSFSNNQTSGVVLSSSNGGAVNVGAMTNNTHTGNGGAGLAITSNTGTVNLTGFSGNVLTNNAGAGVSIDATNSLINANITQNIIGFTGGLGNGGPGVSANSVGGTLNLNVGGAAAGSGNLINSNGGAGVLVSLVGNANGNFSVQNNQITNTTTNANVAGTNGSGIQVNRNANGQLTGTVSGNQVSSNAGSGLNLVASGNTDPNAVPTLSVTGNTFDSNTGNGLAFSLFADVNLDVDVTLNVISNNTLSGVNVLTANNAVFGVAPTVDPLLGPALFDGNLIIDNTQNGVLLNASNNSQLLALFTSDLNTSEISGNGGNGILMAATGAGFAGVDVIGGLNLNSISGNGNFTTNVGAGIQFNDSSGAGSTLFVSGAVIGGASAADGNAGAGIALNAPGTSFTDSVVLVNNSLIQNNGSHGIDIAAGGTTNPNSFFTSGLTLGVTGGTQILDNEGAGVNVQLAGAMGNDFGVSVDLSITNSVIERNDFEGVNLRVDPGTLTIASNGDTHRRVTIQGTPVPPGTATGQPIPPYDPNGPDFQLLSDYAGDFLSTRVQTVVALNIDNNDIQFNGINGGARGDGVFIDIGTNARVNANVVDNTFSGNSLSDFRTQSFISGANPPNAINVNNPNNDTLFLDNPARLSMTFARNTGEQLNVSQSGGGGAAGPTARYTNSDPGKNFGGVRNSRNATIFNVNVGTGANGNTFTNNGVPVGVIGSFNSGVYNVNTF